MKQEDREAYEEAFRRARRFVFKNARPIDLARWQYHFENGSRDAVLDALANYQNTDGGFGYGLEPDFWNPHSSPVQTYEATEILWELGMDSSDAEHPIIQGILDYLSDCKDFDGDYWAHTIETNNRYPHADWWHFPHSSWWEDNAANRFAYDCNPTAGLVGFILYFEDPDTDFYDLAKEMASDMIKQFFLIEECHDMYVVSCFARLYDYLLEAGLADEFPMEQFGRHLRQVVKSTITQDVNLYITMWGVNICRPSVFIQSAESMYYKDNKKIADFELEFIAKTQLRDGSWEVTWDWGKNYPAAWGVAKNWWKTRIVIENLLYWTNMSGIIEELEK